MASSTSHRGGCEQWTNKEQLLYLRSQLPGYFAAQTNGGKKFSDFWAKVFEYFFSHWPPSEPTKEEKELDESITSAKALKTVRYFVF
jgi:hypothetical protein